MSNTKIMTIQYIGTKRKLCGYRPKTSLFIHMTLALWIGTWELLVCASDYRTLAFGSYHKLKTLKTLPLYCKYRTLHHIRYFLSFCSHGHRKPPHTLGTFGVTFSRKTLPHRLVMNDKGLLNTFSRSPLDRLNNQRNETFLRQECEKSHQVRYVIFFHREPLLKLVNKPSPPENESSQVEQAHIAWFNGEDVLVQQLFAAGRQALLLGKWTNQNPESPNISSEIYDKYCLVLDATGIWNSEQISQIQAQPMNVRSLLYKVRLDPQEAAVLAHAQSLLEFHSRHQYCGKCGTLTQLGGMGSKRVCSAGCGMEWFPRSDPVIIVAVVKDDHLLMGRQSSWPLGRYSVIAGFMEHGESIEDAIYREVKEETFVQVGRCRYHSSQPWPFPYSLMLGFVAEASSQTIQVDKQVR